MVLHGKLMESVWCGGAWERMESVWCGGALENNGECMVWWCIGK